VRRIGKAFGIELYSRDVAEDESGPGIVDVNYFPAYRGMARVGVGVDRPSSGRAEVLVMRALNIVSLCRRAGRALSCGRSSPSAS